MFGYGCAYSRATQSKDGKTVTLHADVGGDDLTFTVQPDGTVKEEPSGKTWERVTIRENNVGQTNNGMTYYFFAWDSADYAPAN